MKVSIDFGKINILKWLGLKPSKPNRPSRPSKPPKPSKVSEKAVSADKNLLNNLLISLKEFILNQTKILKAISSNLFNDVSVDNNNNNVNVDTTQQNAQNGASPQNGADTLYESDRRKENLLVKILKGIYNILKKSFLKIYGIIKNFFEDRPNLKRMLPILIIGAIAVFWKQLKPIYLFLKDTIVKIWNSTVEFYNWIKPKIEKVITFLGNVINTISEFLNLKSKEKYTKETNEIINKFSNKYGTTNEEKEKYQNQLKTKADEFRKALSENDSNYTEEEIEKRTRDFIKSEVKKVESTIATTVKNQVEKETDVKKYKDDEFGFIHRKEDIEKKTSEILSNSENISKFLKKTNVNSIESILNSEVKLPKHLPDSTKTETLANAGGNISENVDRTEVERDQITDDIRSGLLENIKKNKGTIEVKPKEPKVSAKGLGLGSIASKLASNISNNTMSDNSTRVINNSGNSYTTIVDGVAKTSSSPFTLLNQHAYGIPT